MEHFYPQLLCVGLFATVNQKTIEPFHFCSNLHKAIVQSGPVVDTDP